MKPIAFKEHNTIFAKDQKPYSPLHAHVGDNGQVISCWKPTLRERIAILFGYPVWLSILTFGHPLQPVKMGVRRGFYENSGGFLRRRGLAVGALALEADDLATLPEYQRSWYAQDPTTKKFRLDPAKVEIEDVSGLKSTVQATREELRKSKEAAAAAVKEALKPFEGIDPVRTREMLSAFASEEEKRLIATGPDGIKKVVEARMEKQREELAGQVTAAVKEKDAALEVAGKFMERVLDNHVRAAAADAGIIPSAIQDALLRARSLFSLNDDGEAVQFEDDGETVVLGKDGKTPFTPKEWLEEMKTKAPHWFPANGSGGGAGGGGGQKGKIDLSKLSATDRLTAARQQQSGK